MENKYAKPELLKTFQERNLNEMMHFIKAACTYFAVLAAIIVPASGLLKFPRGEAQKEAEPALYF